MTDQKQIDELRDYILKAEANLESAKKALFEITGEQVSATTPQIPVGLSASADGKIIEGIFNGENMTGPEGKVFPVPANYASKSKLVPGDKLKLTVAEDGSFIFKQIGPAERKKLVGTLSFEDNMYHVLVDGKRYNLLYAAVTFHKAKPGDKVTIVVPVVGDNGWAALENIIHDVAPTAPAIDDTLDLDLPKGYETKTEAPAAPDNPTASVVNTGSALTEAEAPMASETFNNLGESATTAPTDDLPDLEI
jgi:hypothetical protein